MKIIVNPHIIEIEKITDINSGEYNIQECDFEFSEEYNDLVKNAVFSTNTNSYLVVLENDKCNIPYEVLEDKGNVKLSVFGYEVNGEELIKRYSPKPAYFYVEEGSYKEGEQPTPPTPTIVEQLESQIQSKQDILESGINIKTINNNSILGEGNIDIQGTGGTSDYEELENKPSVNNVELIGNKSLSDLGIENYDDTEIQRSITSLENTKVDKEVNKGLSTNDYTTAEKTKLAGLNNYDDTQVKSDISNLSTTKADKNEIPDVSNFITNAVNDLLNYYLKSETYTKTEVNNLIPDELSDLQDDSTHRLVTDTEKNTWNNKQNELESGTNIKTINNQSILGSGDISISGGGGFDTYFIDNNTTLDISTLKQGVYRFRDAYRRRYITFKLLDNSTKSMPIIYNKIIVYKKYSECNDWDIFMDYCTLNNDYVGHASVFKYSGNPTGLQFPLSNIDYYIIDAEAKNNFGAYAPTLTRTPSSGNDIVNKKYVDDRYKSFSGYDATKTQVLKNVNGTLTWVDE